MKKNSVLIIILAMGIGFFACNKTLNEDTGEPKKFSKLSPEENKSNIQDAGIEMINEMEELATSEAVKASVYGVSLMAESEDVEFKSTPVKILYDLNDLANDRITPVDIMLNLIRLDDDDPETATEAYDEIKGTYSWNSGNEEFDYEEGDKLIVEFPASEQSNSNNAVFTVNEFEWEENSSVEDLDLPGEVPTAIAADLKVDGSTVIDIAFSGSYDNDGIPLNISASITISGFTFSAVLSNSDMKKAEVEYKMKNGDKQLLAVKAGVTGDYSESNIEANTKYIDEECIYNEETWEYECTEKEVTKNDDYDWEEVDIEKILQSSYGYIELMDIRIGGEVDIKNFAPAMEAIEDDEDDAWDAYDEAWRNWEEGDPEPDPVDYKPFDERRVKAMNDYMHFFASYVEDNKKIADVEFYLKEDEDSTFTYNCYWDENIWEYICEEEFDGMETYYRPDGRLIFGDDSKVDTETFFRDGFSKFFDAINDFISTINTEYADYDVEIDEVDYEETMDDMFE